MSYVTVTVNPGFVVRTPGFRFTEGQSLEVDAHFAMRLVNSGQARMADDKPKGKGKTKAAPATETQAQADDAEPAAPEGEAD